MAGETALACLNGAAGFLGQQLAPVLLGFCTCGKLDKEKLEKLRETLNTVNGVLDGAEEKQITEAGRDLFTVMVLKTWIADAKQAIYKAEDLLIEIDNKARRMELVAGSMYQVRNFFISFLCPLSKNEEGERAHKLEKIYERLERIEDKARSLNLMKQPPSHERVPSTSLPGHTRVYGRDQSKEAIKKLLQISRKRDSMKHG